MTTYKKSRWKFHVSISIREFGALCRCEDRCPFAQAVENFVGVAIRSTLSAVFSDGHHIAWSNAGN